MTASSVTREHTDLPDDAGTHRPSRGRRRVWVALPVLGHIALVAVVRVDDSGNAAIVDLQPAAPKSG